MRHCTVCSGENGCSHRRSTRQRRAAPGFSRGVGGHKATRRGNMRYAPGRWAQSQRNASLYGMRRGVCTTTTRRVVARYASDVCTTTMRRVIARYAPDVCTTKTRRVVARYSSGRVHNHNAMRHHNATRTSRHCNAMPAQSGATPPMRGRPTIARLFIYGRSVYYSWDRLPIIKNAGSNGNPDGRGSAFGYGGILTRRAAGTMQRDAVIYGMRPGCAHNHNAMRHDAATRPIARLFIYQRRAYHSYDR